MSELVRTVFRTRAACACTSHHRWDFLQKRQEWKLPTSKLMTKLCAIPASHRGCQGSAKSTDGAHLRKMALPKIQYGSHVNCQPGEENREAITQRELCGGLPMKESCSPIRLHSGTDTHGGGKCSLEWTLSRKSSGLVHPVSSSRPQQGALLQLTGSIICSPT